MPEANAQDPYGAYGGQPTYQVQEDPEYLKALKKQPISYDVGSNTLSRQVGGDQSAYNAFNQAQRATTSQVATGADPWKQDPGYLALPDDQKQKFDSLLSTMQGYQKAEHDPSAYPTQQGELSTMLEQNPAGSMWDLWAPNAYELQNLWGGLRPTSYQMGEGGEYTDYQSFAGKYDYLKPGQYAKIMDNSGKELYLYKDPAGEKPGVFTSNVAPEGLYDVEKADLYSVASGENPMSIYDQTVEAAKQYKYPDIPSLGYASQEIQNSVSPYLQTISDLRPKISELQNMRPEDRAAKEQETGETLTSYLNQMNEAQKSLNTGLEGSGITPPQYDPLTGEVKSPEVIDYEKTVSAQRSLNDAMSTLQTFPKLSPEQTSLIQSLIGAFSQPTVYNQVPNYYNMTSNYYQTPAWNYGIGTPYAQ